jgi:transcriptional regulator with GAF, ATPase, and Fis domain
MVSLNCAALSETLLESELFGHEKGAFTGAASAKVGLLESSSGGTFFMDEVGEMPLATQAKLLRVLEQREVTRVGALRPRAIDVRFIAATNRDLEAEIAAGRFRQDLYFRLNGITLSLPPLRERADEIEPLARQFAAQAARAFGRTATLAPEVVDLLLHYPWPGNIRELRNIMERAVTLSSGDVITRAHLPAERMSATIMLPMKAPSLPSVPSSPVSPAVAPPVPPPAPTLSDLEEPDLESVTGLIAVPPGFGPPSVGAPTASPATASERQRVVEALEKCGGNQVHAAKLLGIARGTLIKRIEEYGLVRPRKRER